MATKYLGLGTVFSVDHDADSQYDDGVISLVINAAPPGREWEEVDETTLDASLQTNSIGIEKHSHYSFRIKWDPGDTIHAALITLAEARSAVNWRIVFTAATNETWTFAGKITKFQPQSVEHNKHLEAEVTVHRTGAITVS